MIELTTQGSFKIKIRYFYMRSSAKLESVVSIKINQYKLI